MTAIFIILIVLLILSFVTAFLLFGKEQPQEVQTASRVDNPAVLFDTQEESLSKKENIGKEEEEEEII